MRTLFNLHNNVLNNLKDFALNKKGFLILSGESGSGKSSLLRKLCQELKASKLKVIYFSASLNNAHVPYASFASFFQELLASSYLDEKSLMESISTEHRELIENFSPFFTAQSQSQEESVWKKRQKTFANILDLLSSISENQKVLWIIDGYQWLDKDSHELIKFLVSHLHKTGINLIFTINHYERSDWINAPDEHIQLNKISIDTLPSLVQDFLGLPLVVGHSFYEKLLLISEGLPLLVIKAIEHLQENKIIKKKNNEWYCDERLFRHWEFPSGYSSWLDYRLNEFSAQEKKVLKIAAVMDQKIRIEHIKRVLFRMNENTLPDTSLQQLMEKAVLKNFLIDETNIYHGEYCFTNHSIRQFLLQKTSPEKKSKIHAVYAEILEEEPATHHSVFEIAFHYNNCFLKQKKKDYNLKAYHQAKIIQSTHEKIYYLSKLVDNILTQNSISSLEYKYIKKLIQRLQFTGQIDQSFAYLEQGLQFAEMHQNFKEFCDFLLLMGKGYYILNESDRALEFYEKAVAHANRHGEIITNPEVYKLMGSSYFFRYRLDNALKYLTLAVYYAPENNWELLLTSLGIRSWTYEFSGEMEKAHQDILYIEKHLHHINDSLLLSQLHHYISSYYIISSSQTQEKGRYNAKLAFQYAQKSNNVLLQYSSLAGKMGSFVFSGQHNKAEIVFQEAFQMSLENRIYIGINMFWLLKVYSLLMQNKLDEANSISQRLLYSKEPIKEMMPKIVFMVTHAIYLFTHFRDQECREIIKKAHREAIENHIVLGEMFILVMESYFLEQWEIHDEATQSKNRLETLLSKHPGVEFIYTVFKTMQESVKSSRKNKKMFPSDGFTPSLELSSLKHKLQLSHVVKASQIISSILDRKNLLNAIVEHTMDMTRAERGGLFLYNNSKHLHEEVVIHKNSRKQFTIPSKAVQEIEKSHKGLILNGEYCSESHLASGICVPLLLNKKLTGILYLETRLLETLFHEEDLDLLQIFCSQAAISIENARQNSIIQKQNQAIRRQFYDSIEIITSMIYDSSSRLYDFIRQVAQIAVLIAREIKLTFEETERIRIAALLHDLGMIGVAEKHVFGGKTISETENQLLEHHPQKSADFMKYLQGSQDIRDMILQHHEYYDGSGYPHGLQGESILLGARILTLADEFILMQAKRKFQTKDKRDKIIASLQKKKGKKLDPYLTDVLIELIEKKQLIYMVNEADMTVKETENGFEWSIPSNIHFEIPLVGKIMQKIYPMNLDPDLVFSLDYSLSEIIRNAIVHGNQYDEKKRITVSYSLIKNDNKTHSIRFTVRDQGQGMDIEEHNKFSQSRKELFSAIEELREYQKTHKDTHNLDAICEAFTQFKTRYYTDFNTFRQMENADFTGGVGLLYVKRSFDSVDFKHIIENNRIQGLEVSIEKEL